MRDCIEEGTLQSFFDGELSREMMEGVASHLASCLVCTQALRELESESLLLAEALEPELSMSVPTERLRNRIDTAISGLQVVSPVATSAATPSWFRSLADLFTVAPQRTLAYAGMAAVVLLVAILGISQLNRRTPRTPQFARTQQPSGTSQPSNGTTAPSKDSVARLGTSQQGPTPITNQEAPTKVITPVRDRAKKGTPNQPSQSESDHVKLLPGERSYLKTIAELDSTIKAENSARPMRPALQAEYERNLAMVDRAIATTRTVVKKNPNDADAADFMFAAYQSKIDLLNQVADARLYNKQH